MLVAMALVSGGVVLASTHRLEPALVAVLDLLLAAGLLRLAGTPSLAELAIVAGLVPLRRLARVGLSAGRRARPRMDRGQAP
ncbi:hypothetical protein [Sporichthya sp.]|uniref:hypothetical protein n=1 Tax=Sporichthya sp. TaxID=65475 RepID=UPI0017C53F08|nr:hypothetical protein [Sporichthya sp.]MBA3743211.1 hypothetical protein [Sporichthya sp.]